jgi:hypothetical protein
MLSSPAQVLRKARGIRRGIIFSMSATYASVLIKKRGANLYGCVNP